MIHVFRADKPLTMLNHVLIENLMSKIAITVFTQEQLIITFFHLYSCLFIINNKL